MNKYTYSIRPTSQKGQVILIVRQPGDSELMPTVQVQMPKEVAEDIAFTMEMINDLKLAIEQKRSL